MLRRRRHAKALGGHEAFVVRGLAYLPTLSTNVEIGDQLNISVNTVKQHLKSINRTLLVGTRREAVRAARRRGLLSDPS